jgi:hypothetical protein
MIELSLSIELHPKKKDGAEGETGSKMF